MGRDHGVDSPLPPPRSQKFLACSHVHQARRGRWGTSQVNPQRHVGRRKNRSSTKKQRSQNQRTLKRRHSPWCFLTLVRNPYPDGRDIVWQHYFLIYETVVPRLTSKSSRRWLQYLRLEKIREPSEQGLRYARENENAAS